MSVGRFFLFSFAQNLNRSTSAHFHITFCGFVSGCEALALSSRAACIKPLLYADTGN